MNTPSPASGAGIPATLQALAVAARVDVTARKLLICRRAGIGREVLGALTRAGVSWVGFDETTPDRLAQELVGHELAADGIARGDQFALLALLDESIDEVIATGRHTHFAELAETAGFRDAIRGSIETLRLEDVTPSMLTSAGVETRKAHFMAEILQGYERRMEAAGVADAALELKRAIGVLRADRTRLPVDQILILPDQDDSGLRGLLLQELLHTGAIVLPADPVYGVESPARLCATVVAPPTLLSYAHAPAKRPADTPGALPKLFAAANPVDELREVLRRVIAAGFAWDEVEIVATDGDVYGNALDSLARGLGIPVTFASGLPIERTRVGRAVTRYLQWVQDGFRADTFGRLLESGDVAPGETGVSGAAASRELRELRIGAGRDRYVPAIDRALRRAERGNDEMRAPRRDALKALKGMLAAVLDATPRVDSPDDAIAPAEIAAGIRALLDFVPPGAGAEAVAREKLIARVERAAGTLTRRTKYGAALAILRGRLQVRVPAQGEDGPAPWRSAPGHLHFADIEYGGFTGRRATFVVGLDANRFPGGGAPDALLSDSDRYHLSAVLRATDGGRAPLMSSAERTALRRHRLAALLSRLRGAVTLSFSAWDPAEARVVAPASIVLQAYRLDGNPLASYENLRTHLHEHGIASAVPRGATLLDASDVWLCALDPGAGAAAGSDLVASAFPMLQRGLAARDARQSAEPGAYHGLLPADDARDPRVSGALQSASALETLGACGLRWFYRYLLDLRAPEELPDAGVWLDPLARGALMHRVFERTLRSVQDAGIDVQSEDFDACVQRVLEEDTVAERELRPAPSDYVFNRTVASLRADLAVFVRLVRDDAARGSRFQHAELTFGMRGAAPVSLRVGAGELNVRGSIDRVDRLADGRLVIIDYKTGGSYNYRREAFNGGRRLQHLIYARAAEAMLGNPVARTEYQFTSVKGEGKRAVYDAAQLAEGADLLDALLNGVSAGYLTPTDDPNDCKFCDYRACCRVRAGRFGHESPMAAWAAGGADLDEVHPSLAHWRTLRSRFE